MSIIEFRQRIILGIFFLLAFVPMVRAEPLRLGRSPYALTSEHFNYNEYKRQTQDVGQYQVTWLWKSFGMKLANAKEEIQRPNVVGMELALFNTTCVSNGNCAKYETLYGYSTGSLEAAIKNNDQKLKAKLVADANEAGSFVVGNLPAGKPCNINPFLESRLSRASWQRATEWIAPSFQGRCGFVWNPVGGNPGTPQPPANISEGHGDAPQIAGFCIANPDGTKIAPDAYPSFLAKYGNYGGGGCLLASAWLPNDNCRNSTDRATTDPRARSCKETSDFGVLRNAMKGAQKLNVDIPAWSDEDNSSLNGCYRVNKNPDGLRGFLSKESDAAHWYAWTVLLPAIKDSKGHYTNYKQFQAVKAGKPIYTWGKNMTFLYTEDKSNRPVWRACAAQGRCSKASTAPFNVVLKALDFQNHWQCWKVTNPRVRND